MKNEKFNLIIEGLDRRINACKKHFHGIKETIDLTQLTIAEAVLLRDFCKSEETDMTKIAMVDLYHVIGMGNLTPIQMVKFTYKIQEYLSFRPNIKAIANKLDSISDLPKLPVATRYQLMAICNLTLTSDVDNGCEDVASVDDYDKVKNGGKPKMEFTKALPYQLDGKTITVDLSKADEFAAVLTVLFNTPFCADNLKSKIGSRKTYAGIEWLSIAGTLATGTITADNHYQKLKSYYDKISSKLEAANTREM